MENKSKRSKKETLTVLDNIVKAVLNTPPKKTNEWKYFKRKQEKS